MKQKETIHYFTNIAPHYRQRLWELMAEDHDLKIKFYFGTSNIGIKELNFQNKIWKEKQNQLEHLNNIRLFNRIVWQQGVVKKVFFGNVKKALFLADANIVSTWIAAIFLRLKGGEVFFWGHGFSGEEFFLKRFLKILFNKVANQHFVYGRFAKNTMVKYGFKSDLIHLVYNSLDYEKHKKLREKVIGDELINDLFKNPTLPILVFIGRLTEVKKLDLLVEAVGILNRDENLYNLLIIGEGDKEFDLKKMANSLLDDETYCFYGPCYKEKEIGKLLANSDLCISPGNVGLTAIHSLSFGTPVCSHNNFNNQMPEHEAIIPGHTGFFFEESNVNDLVFNVKKWFNKIESRKKIREACYNIIDTYYNPYQQIKIFKKVLLNR